MQLSFPAEIMLVRIYSDLLLVLTLCLWITGRLATTEQLAEAKSTARGKRERHPQTPRDCPACCAKHKQLEIKTARTIPSWSAQHSRRGRRKQVKTDGYSCNNPECLYYRVTDSTVHALVGDGVHHGIDNIQYFKCQACGRKVSSRWDTPMYDLKTSSQQVARVMTASSEGVDLSAANRIFGHDERTISRWLARTAQHAERLHSRYLKDLVCHHLQLDELVTRLRGVKERIFVWVALDAQTKLIITMRCSGRTRIDAQLFVHQLWSQLAPGLPPVFTTDGLQQYYYALTAHFGCWHHQEGKRWPVWRVDPRLLYGQLHKIKVGFKLKDMYTQVLCGTRAEFRAALQAMAFTGKVMTAYVERVNLTLREHIPPLSRRTWSLAQDQQTLDYYLEWGRAYYHFFRFHEGLRLPTTRPNRYRSRTPAMAAGFVRKRWCVNDFLLMPLTPA